MKTTIPLFCVCVMLILAAGCSLVEKETPPEPPPGVWYRENFRSYPEKNTGLFAEKGVAVANDPIWDNSACLNVRLKENGSVFRTSPHFMTIPFRSGDLRFRFRFTGTPAEKGSFTAVLEREGERSLAVVFTRKTVSVRQAATKETDGIEYSADLKSEIPLNEWRGAAIRVDGTVLTVYLAKGLAYEEVLKTQIPSFGVTGFNFKGGPDAQFDLTDLSLNSPMPFPKGNWNDSFAIFGAAAGARPGAAGEEVSLKDDELSGQNDIVRFSIEDGKPVLRLRWNDKTSDEWTFTTEPYRHKILKTNETKELADAVVVMRGATPAQPSVKKFVRPLLKRFHSAYSAVPMYRTLLEHWDRLPGAKDHVISVAVQKMPDGRTGIYLDGSYVFALDKKGAKLEEITLTGGLFRESVAGKLDPFDYDRYLPLDAAANPRARAFAACPPSFEKGFQPVSGIPMIVTDAAHSSDVGICRQGQGEWALEVDEYLARSPMDGFPFAIHYRVPAYPYNKAWLLCAVDPDLTKDRVLTVRLAKFRENGIGNNLISQTTAELKDIQIPGENFHPVGTVKQGDKTLPLFLAELPLDAGKILDLADPKNDYLDFEVLGKPWINFEQVDRTAKPDPDSVSAFQIYGVTLEKSPVMLNIEQIQPGNVFTRDEKKPRLLVHITALTPCKGYLTWMAYDSYDVPVFTGKVLCNFEKTGEVKEIEIPFRTGNNKQLPNGYFELEIAWKDAIYRPRLRHCARFAFLPPDTRASTYKTSPFGTWWFKGTHGALDNLDTFGTLMRKAGIRKASAGTAGIPQSAMDPYKISTMGNVMFPLSIRDIDPATKKFRPVTIPDPKDKTKKITVPAEEFVREKLASAIAANPNADHVMIWHESAPGSGIPEELLGLPVPETPDRFKLSGAFINEAGAILRKHFPKMKIQIGNSSASIGAAVWPLRTGANIDFYDYLGIETPSQVIPPEQLQEVGFSGFLIAKDAAKFLGGKDIAANGCYEFTYRCERDMGDRQQAAWYVRDALVSLIHGFTRISPGIFSDCTNAYYNSLWGASGIVTRMPFNYPKRAYVAYAVLTSVMDNVKFVRLLPTGSNSVYAAEFSRPDGKHVYAFWTQRGEVDLALKMKEHSAGTVTSLYGVQTAFDAKKTTVRAGTDPVYVETVKPIDTCGIVKRFFPEEDKRALQTFQVIDPKTKTVGPEVAFDDPELLLLQPDPAFASEQHAYLPILKPSDFTMRSVDDKDKGKCLEIALDLSKNKETSKYITEYTTVRLKEPVLLAGTPDAVGVWVYGDSNGGRIRFEIEDANGEIFRSMSTGSWGCDIFDWPGNLRVNFDSWAFLACPLRASNLFPDHSPGPVSEQWVSAGGDKVIDYPVKLRAVTVGINRHTPALTGKFIPSPAVVRLGGAGGVHAVESRPRPF